MEKETSLDCVFKERFNGLIKSLNLNQKDIADGAGITRQAVSLYATGKRTPDINTLSKICKVLDVSADYLLGRSELKSSDLDNKEIHQRLGLTDKSIKILSSYNEEFHGNRLIPIVNYLLEQEMPLEIHHWEEKLFNLTEEWKESGISSEEIEKKTEAFKDEIKKIGEDWQNDSISSLLSIIERYFSLNLKGLIQVSTFAGITLRDDIEEIKKTGDNYLPAYPQNVVIDFVIMDEIRNDLKILKENYQKLSK